MTIQPPIVVAARIAHPTAEIDLVVPENLEYFAGHFPGVPVVPGVVQIGWALLLAEQYLGVSGAFAGMEALKFHGLMRPGASATLALECPPPGRKLRFLFRSDGKRYSSGRLLFRADV